MKSIFHPMTGRNLADKIACRAVESLCGRTWWAVWFACFCLARNDFPAGLLGTLSSLHAFCGALPALLPFPLSEHVHSYSSMTHRLPVPLSGPGSVALLALKKFTCMEYFMKFICKIFSQMCVTFRDESNTQQQQHSLFFPSKLG